jgi:hypothetical protein
MTLISTYQRRENIHEVKKVKYGKENHVECDCFQELNPKGTIMSVLLNSTQSMIHNVYSYYLWTQSLAGTVSTGL